MCIILYAFSASDFKFWLHFNYMKDVLKLHCILPSDEIRGKDTMPTKDIKLKLRKQWKLYFWSGFEFWSDLILPVLDIIIVNFILRITSLFSMYVIIVFDFIYLWYSAFERLFKLNSIIIFSFVFASEYYGKLLWNSNSTCPVFQEHLHIRFPGSVNFWPFREVVDDDKHYFITPFAAYVTTN